MIKRKYEEDKHGKPARGVCVVFVHFLHELLGSLL